MRRYELLVFLTGAVTLALEVMASRIMTPYFGVSLYIWAGILSITLTFLAAGYYWGGRVTAGAPKERLELLILAAPVAAAASIGLSIALYPLVFPVLARFDLIVGSFVAATLLLGLPLVGLSALNPLLIGLQLRGDAAGDAGAGRIFFISTVGSVAGVIATAFFFIPNFTNFRAALALALLLCAVAGALSALAAALSTAQRRLMIVGSVLVALCCAALLAGKNRYLDLLTARVSSDLLFEVRAEYTSHFGNLKVVDARRRDGEGTIQRLLVQDGLIQNRSLLDFRSSALYVYALEHLARAYQPFARDALVLGLGAGVVPRGLAAAGLDVSVVEINPDVLAAAEGYFGFDPTGIEVRHEDARTFVRRCHHDFDVIVVDLFLGDSVPDYLLSREFFGDLRGCLRERGSIVMNTFDDADAVGPHPQVAATVGSAFPTLHFARHEQNAFFVASVGPVPRHLRFHPRGMPRAFEEPLREIVEGGRRVTPRDVAGVAPVSDDHNVFSVVFARSDMRRRQAMAGMFPPRILAN